MHDRGQLFVDVNTEVYKGWLLEKEQLGDLDVNIIREKINKYEVSIKR